MPPARVALLLAEHRAASAMVRQGMATISAAQDRRSEAIAEAVDEAGLRIDQVSAVLMLDAKEVLWLLELGRAQRKLNAERYEPDADVRDITAAERDSDASTRDRSAAARDLAQAIDSGLYGGDEDRKHQANRLAANLDRQDARRDREASSADRRFAADARRKTASEPEDENPAA